jgi:hypothetical protein
MLKEEFMFKKKLIALGLSAAMVCSFVACGDSSSSTENSTTPTTAASTGDDSSTTEGSAATSSHADGSDDHSAISADCIVDFEDGVSDFAIVNEATFTGDKECTAEVKENEFGSKVLYMTRPNGGETSVAIDIVGLLGDNASKCTKITLDLGIDSGDTFNALSGSVDVYLGENNTLLQTKYSIYKEDAIEKTVTIELTDTLTEGNYLTFNSIEDTSAENATPQYIDNIICYDADGNALPLDSTVTFAVEGVGARDWSNGVKQPADEVVVISPNTVQNGGWWPQDEDAFSFQPSDSYTYYEGTFGPGDVLTIYYSVADPESTDYTYQAYPYIRTMNYPELDEDGNEVDDGSNWAYNSAGIIDIHYEDSTSMPLTYDEDGTPTDGAMVNESFTIVQYTYEYILEQFNAKDIEEFTPYCDFFGVADRGAALNIEAVTIGKAQ